MTPDTQIETSAEAAPHASARTCVGCGASVALEEISEGLAVRVILGPPHVGGAGTADAREIAVDVGARRSGGRGASLHPTPKCVGVAAQRGLNRAFKSKLAVGGRALDGAALAGAIVAALDRRVAGMLGAAARSKNAVVGSEPVCAILRSASSGPHALVVVATNAEAAANTTEVRRAVSEGRAVAWSDKEGLAAAVHAGGRSEGVGVVAIVERNLAGAVKTAVQQADGLRGFGTSVVALGGKSAVE